MSLASVLRNVKNRLDIQLRRKAGAWLFQELEHTDIIYPMKADSVLRSSRLGDFCPRQETICTKYNINRTWKIEGKLQWAFDVGTLTHHLYRDWYMGPRGAYLGSWKCLCCGWNTDGDCLDRNQRPMNSLCPEGPHPASKPFRLVRMPGVCGGCGAPRVDDEGYRLIVFHEWQLFNDKYGVSGHTDGWIKKFDGKIIQEEIKSASPSSFKFCRSNGPYSSHVLQFNLYLWMAGFRRGEITYLNKAAWGDWKDEIASHEVEYNGAWLKEVLLDRILDARECIRGNVLAKRICEDPKMPRAKACSQVEICFKENT